MPLATSLYDWLLFLHILAAAVWLGGLVTISLLTALVQRSRDADLVRRLLDSLRVVGPVAFGAPMLAVLALGIWMVVDSTAWSVGQDWVISALALFAAAFAIGVAFQARAAIGARRAVEAGDLDEALRQLRRWAWGMRGIVVLLVAAVWDMVAKPVL